MVIGASFYQILEGFLLLSDGDSCDKITMEVKFDNFIFCLMSRGSFAVNELTANYFIRGYKMAYRTEHPNPQFRRESYECLNGEWEFEIGTAEGKTNIPLSSVIEVPFCSESKLSGIGITDFIPDCIYSRMITVTEEDLRQRLVLHCGAVDHRATVYLNGIKLCSHIGGYTPLDTELNTAAKIGENRLTIVVHDDTREKILSGKQSNKSESFGCFYTRTTGIWQTVWLERTPKIYIRSCRFYPDEKNNRLEAEVETEGSGTVFMRVLYEGREVGFAESDTVFRKRFCIPLSERHLWEVGNGCLYDVEISIGTDKVYSYFGLRSVGYEGYRFLLNGKSVFQRLVLDQGYYPDGIYTAPSVQNMKEDIALSQSLGFNGARLHQKLFEPRYLYECDRAGYMVWGEYASWGIGYDNLQHLGAFLTEWREAMERDFNHPCIVQWCPLNETWENLDDRTKTRDIRFVETVYAFTKALDATRPCVDVSGGYHGRYTDLFDFHCYHSPEEIAEYRKAIEERGELIMDTLYAAETERGAVYNGALPLHASEYGGVAFSPDGRAAQLQNSTPCVQEQNAWGYRASVSEEEFVKDYIGATKELLGCEKISGYCYTQLYDVEQEQNGLYTYDRHPKFSKEAMQKIKECNQSVAEIEKMRS